MKNVAIVTADGTVENVVVVDDQADPKSSAAYRPPADRRVVEIPDGVGVEPGGKWNGKTFSPRAVPAPSPDEARLVELRSKAAAGTLAAGDLLDAVRIALIRGRI
jgi:hypothetical protein